MTIDKQNEINAEMSSLDFYKYQFLACKTANSDLPPTQALAVWALGLAGESGEVAELIKKALGHGHELDLDEVKKELGDVLWYIAAMCRQLGFTMAEVAEINIAKLKARYPDGFNTKASINREEKKLYSLEEIKEVLKDFEPIDNQKTQQ